MDCRKEDAPSPMISASSLSCGCETLTSQTVKMAAMSFASAVASQAIGMLTDDSCWCQLLVMFVRAALQ